MAVIFGPDPVPTDCASWVRPETLGFLELVDDVGHHVDLTLVCCAAAKVLHELSGRQFGIEKVLGARPVRISDGCGCGGVYAAGYSGWFGGGLWNGWMGGGCGCGDARAFVIPGPVVRSIDAITIDGAVLASSAYVLYRDNLLERIDGRSWPYCCQVLSTPAGQPGSWSIDLTWGVDVPADGKVAAIELAAHIANALTGGDCQLNDRVTQVIRSGVSMTLLDPAMFLNGGKTGLYLCDLFLSAENPYGHRSRPSVSHPLLSRLAVPR